MSVPSAPPPYVPPGGAPPSPGLSVASMVCGILSLLVCFIPYFGVFISIPLAILAIILGFVGMNKGGKGMAIAGLVCGIVSIALIILGFLFLFSLLGWGSAAAKDALKDLQNLKDFKDAFKDLKKF